MSAAAMTDRTSARRAAGKSERRFTRARYHRRVTNGAPTPVPPAGCRVLVTRPAEQAAPLADALRAAGAVPVLYPTIEVVEPPDWAPFDQAFATAAAGDWVVLTSPSAVRLAAARLRATGRAHELARLRIAVVGPGTAAALASLGVEPAVVPEAGHRNQEGLADALAAVPRGARVIFPRALEGREALPRLLGERGVQVETVPVSQTRTRALPPLPAFDAALFASPSALRAFVAGWTVAPLQSSVTVAIGPVTAQAMRDLGLTPAVAVDPTPAALVAALGRAMAR
jgi:uroporphyrinogen-III synthase